MLPPENNEDFDSHLQTAMADLNKLKELNERDIILIYCSKDFENGNKAKFTPSLVKENLDKKGLNVLVIFCLIFKIATNLLNFSL